MREERRRRQRRGSLRGVRGSRAQRLAGRGGRGRALGQLGPHGAFLWPPRLRLSGCRGNRRLSWWGGPGCGLGGRVPQAGYMGEGGPACGFQGVSCGHPPCDPWSLAPQRRGPPGLSLSGPLGERSAGGHKAPESVRSLQGWGDIPRPTACPGFPVHTAARSPLVCQLKALSPSYFCTTSSRSTNSASKETCRAGAPGDPCRRNWILSH